MLPSPTSEPNPSQAITAEDLPVDVRWDEFDLSEELLQGLEDAGYVHPTPVQVASIPPILEGREVTVQARTGTGKTAAFGLPLLELLDPYRKEIQAIVLAPTRELARQVASEMAVLGKHSKVRAVAIYGGDPMREQVSALKRGAQIVVGTPGRVLDHLSRGTLVADAIEYLVLDEADEMLSMGFARELADVLSYLPDEYKTLLFSATFPPEIERLFARHQVDPVHVRLSSDTMIVDTVEHHFYLASRLEKDRHLVAVLDEENVQSAIVFCNRRDETRMVANSLRRHGFHALPINADLTQAERNEVMTSIKRGELNILVATDIAARGIDISKLSHVINYSVPETPEQYVHRTGRTGRVGRRGTAVTLVGGQELSALRLIEKIKGIKMQERRLPSEDVMMERRVDRLVEDLKRVAKLRTPEEKMKGDRPELHAVAEKIREDPASREVIYLLLQSFFEGVKKTAVRALDTESRAAAGEITRGPEDEGGERAASAPRKRSRSRSRSR